MIGFELFTVQEEATVLSLFITTSFLLDVEMMSSAFKIQVLRKSQK